MLPFLVVLREPKRTLQEEDEKAYVERKLKKVHPCRWVGPRSTTGVHAGVARCTCCVECTMAVGVRRRMNECAYLPAFSRRMGRAQIRTW